MNKELFIFLIILGIIVFIAAFPAMSTRAENSRVKSYGNLLYMKGEKARIEIYSEDIQYLADEIDRLKAEIK